MKLHTTYFEEGSVIERFCSQRVFNRTVANWRRLTSAGCVLFNYDS